MDDLCLVKNSSMHPLNISFLSRLLYFNFICQELHIQHLRNCSCAGVKDAWYWIWSTSTWKDRHIFFKVWFLGVVSVFTQGLFSKHFWKFQCDFFPPNQIWPPLALSFGYRVRHSVKYNYRWWSDWRSCKRFPFQWRRCNCHCLVHGLERQHHHWLPLIRATLTSHSTFKNMFIFPR